MPVGLWFCFKASGWRADAFPTLHSCQPLKLAPIPSLASLTGSQLAWASIILGRTLSQSIESALAARPLLDITIGPGSRNRSNQLEELVALVKNNVALVPNVAAVVFTVHPAVWSAECRWLIIQELPLGVEVVKIRVVDPDRQVEASVTCYYNTYGNPTFSSSFASPIFQLDAQDVERVVALPNLYNLIIRSSPISQQPFDRFSDSFMRIVESSNQLRTVVLSADLSIRLEARGILSALQDHGSLNSLTITPAISFNYTPPTPASELLLEDALIHGLENLSQIEVLDIPVEVCKPLLLGALARLTGLRVLMIRPSTIISPYENASLFHVVHREIYKLPGFGQLRIIGMCATGTHIQASLNKVFPNTTIL
jgi:hypothetical protein